MTESKVDLLAVIAKHRDAHKSLSETDAYSAQEYPRLAAAYDAVAELIERGEYLCRTGEGMIAFRAALAACTPAKEEGR